MSETIRYKIGLDGSSFERGMGSAIGQVTKLGGVLAGLGAGAVFVGLIKQGFAFNKTMKDSEAAIAQVLAQFKGLDAAASKREAAAAMQQIIDLEPKAAGSLQDLTGGFLATLAASQSAGLSVQQNIDLVGRFANAMANAALPTEQLAQEMRSIITANIGADSSLARILGITNEMVSQARESGQLYQFLTQRIGKLGEAGDTAQVAFSSLQSALDKAAGALTAGLFDQAVDGSKQLTAVITENIGLFRDMGAVMAQAAAAGIEAFKGLLWTVNETMRAVKMLALVSSGMSFAEAEESLQAMEKAQQIADAYRERMDKARRARETSAPAAPTAPAGLPAPAAGQPGTANREPGTETTRRPRRIVSRRDGSTLATPHLMGSAGGGGLDHFHRMQQKREFSFDEQQALRKQRGGGRGLPIGQSSSYVPVYNAFPSREDLNRVTNPNARPVGDRIAAATRREDRQQQRSNQQSDPTLQTLKAIEAELKRIRTA